MEIDCSKAPEGATHYNEHDATTPWRKVDTGGTAYWWTGAEWVRVEGKGYHAWYIAIPNDSAPQWDGTGLPPVGTVCEVEDEDGNWHECRILAHYLDDAVFSPDPDYPHGAYDGLPAGRFRPIRAPEQIASEEALEEIERLYSEGGPAAVFDAGYRKQA